MGARGNPNAFECPTGQGDPDNYAAALYLYAADLTLEQTAGPTVTSPAGELATAPEPSGTADLTFTAADPGSGVYEALVTVDGHPFQSTVLDEAGGRCHDVGQTTDGLPAFLYLDPCPASVSADLPVDLSPLAPGAHHLVVTVTDAAGNAAPVLDRTILIPSPPGSQGQPPQPPASGVTGNQAASSAGSGASGATASSPALLSARWQSTSSTRLTVSYGHRETITGRLTSAAGQPIAGAQIAMLSTPALTGAATSAARGATTARNGTFAIRLAPHLTSRTIRLIYTSRRRTFPRRESRAPTRRPRPDDDERLTPAPPLPEARSASAAVCSRAPSRAAARP